MAILPDVRGLRVEVHVNGAPLKEYDDDEDAPPQTVSKFIESVSGAEFEIRYFFEPPFPTIHGVKAEIRLDGKLMRGSLHQKHELIDSRGHRCDGATSHLGGQAFTSRFNFAELKIGMKLLQTKAYANGHCRERQWTHSVRAREKGTGVHRKYFRAIFLPRKDNKEQQKHLGFYPIAGKQ